MAYTPTDWQTGDVVTADKLNNLENGVLSASGSTSPLIVRYLEDTSKTDKTTREIRTAFESGTPVLYIQDYDTSSDSVCIGLLLQFESNDGYYSASFGSNAFMSNSLDDGMSYAE